MGAFIKDEPALAKGKVRYVGEIVAAVAADSEAIARAGDAPDPRRLRGAAGRAVDPAAALAPGRRVDPRGLGQLRQGLRRRHRRQPLLAHRASARATSTPPGRECDVVVEATYQTQAQAHLSLEPCGALAEIDAGGRITLWSANQSVFRVQANVCESLGLPMTQLRCLTPRVGAGFGNKMEAHVQPVVVLLAMKARRPVQADPFARGRLRDGAGAPSVHDPHEDRRQARRHAGRARDRAAARRRRLRRRQPRRARLRPADELRPVPDPARARARPGRLHQQAALRRVPRLRRAAGRPSPPNRSSTSSPRSSASTRSRCAGATC